MSATRFSATSDAEINEKVLETTPKNTLISQKSIWKQFEAFCNERNYKLEQSTPVTTIASIMKDWAYNMKRSNGDDYKETVVKTMWNKTAKILQEMYYNDFKISFDPFKNIEFKSARDARNAKRRVLLHTKRRKPQNQPRKRNKPRSIKLSETELAESVKCWDEDTPCGLQRKFFHIASYELAWRCAKATQCVLQHFRKEINNRGQPTGRIEYNTTFPKSPQDGDTSHWLTPNDDTPDICPVRLFNKLISKRESRITTYRLFLTPNISWTKPNTSGWYKNASVGINQIMKWMKDYEERVGLRAPAETSLVEESGDDEEEVLEEVSGVVSSSDTGMNEQLELGRLSDNINDVGIKGDGNTKRCRTCLAAACNPKNLRDAEYEPLLKILQCLLDTQIQDEIFEICVNCEVRLTSVIQTKELCLKSMQGFGNIQCKTEIKQELMEVIIEEPLSTNNFQDIFIKEELEVVEEINDKPILKPRTSPVAKKHSVFTNSNPYPVPINPRKDVYRPDRPFVPCKRGPKTLSEYHIPHQVLHYSKYPRNEVIRAISEFNTSRNIQNLRTCLLCGCTSATATKLFTHMNSTHRDAMKTWCSECNIQSDNLLAHKVTKKCSYFFCKFCNKHCTPLNQAERHFRNHHDFISPKV